MNTPTNGGASEGEAAPAVPGLAAPEPPSLSVVMANTLGDAVAATDRMLATVSAWRAETIDQLRQWSEVSVPNTPGPAAGGAGWDAPPSRTAPCGNDSTPPRSPRGT